MKKSFLLLALGMSLSAHAVKLKDYQPYNYEVLFTNPECATYVYENPVRSNSGEMLTQKPQNVYCTYNDARKSQVRDTSPNQRLVDLIRDSRTETLHMSYLSFSNGRVISEICKALKDDSRDLKVTLYMAQSPGKEDKLKECAPSRVKVLKRGKVGGAFGYHHNKLFMVNLFHNDRVVIAFSSGNMSSGTVLHHENWHFVTTSPKSYFAQSHRCVIDATTNAKSRSAYQRMIDNCQSAIDAPVEEDIKHFFTPGDGEEAIEYIEKAIWHSNTVKLAAHRFFLNELRAALANNLRYDGTTVRMIFDDDTYWIGTDGLRTADRVDTMKREYYNVRDLVRLGADVRWFETNHAQHLLHHNKFLIFSNDYQPEGTPELAQQPAVFAGAGNFTNGAFKMSSSTTNYENYYYITIPEVVEAFNKQYDKMFNEMGTATKDMPSIDAEVVKKD